MKSELPNETNEAELTESQMKVCEENYYFMPRIIGGKLCALHQYFTTVGLVIGIDDFGYERRYCYQNSGQAVMAMLDYNDISVHAPYNWIKCKGAFEGAPIDLFNPEWKNDQGD